MFADIFVSYRWEVSSLPEGSLGSKQDQGFWVSQCPNKAWSVSLKSQHGNTSSKYKNHSRLVERVNEIKGLVAWQRFVRGLFHYCSTGWAQFYFESLEGPRSVLTVTGDGKSLSAFEWVMWLEFGKPAGSCVWKGFWDWQKARNVRDWFLSFWQRYADWTGRTEEKE